MFFDEVKEKLNLSEAVAEFVVLFYGSTKIVLSGIKGISYYSENEIRVKVKGKILVVKGERLSIVEVASCEVYIYGEVKSFEIV